MKYFFVPGRKWRLAQAELRAVLQKRLLRAVELSSNEHLFLFDIDASESQINDLFHILGGTVKAGVVIDDPFEYLSLFIADRNDKCKNKVNFAISFHDVISPRRSEIIDRNLLGMKIKKWFREKGISARFVSNSSSLETSAVLINTNHVLDRGFEINRFSHPKSGATVWGVTGAIQDYEGFARRDYSRPRSNKLKGMIPPKLARIMINLAQVPKGGIIWDPFCGSGTILMEALTLGYSVVGSDLDPISIEETTENLYWICEEYWISHKNYSVFSHDIHRALPPDIKFHAIVTEPYLGPVAQQKLGMEDINGISKEIRPLFGALGFEIDRQIDRNRHGSVVVVVPGFLSRNGWVDMDEKFNGHPSIKKVGVSEQNIGEPLQWDRPNSIIRRNISQFTF